MAFGQTVYWTVPSSDAASHSVVDDNGTGLFDSGPLVPGGSFSTQLFAAGGYRVIDSATGHSSVVSVTMTAAPTSGTTSTTFALQWASVAPPAGYVFDVFIKRPGTTAFVSWETAQTATGASFTPDAGTGTYSFASRLREVSNGHRTCSRPPARSPSPERVRGAR